MKWQNLTNRIRGPIFVVVALVNLLPINILTAQDEPRALLLLAKCWKSPSDDPSKHIIASDNEGSFFLTKTGGKVDRLDARTGKRIWRSEFGGEIVTVPVADGNMLFLATNSFAEGSKSGSGSLRAISLATGIPLWTVSLPYSADAYLAETESSIIVIAHGGSIFAHKKADGALLWQVAAGAALSGKPQLSAGSLNLPLESGEIVLVSADNGTIEARIKMEISPLAVFRANVKTLIIGDKKGNVSAIEIPVGTLKWKFKNGGAVSGIIGSKNGTLITSHDNFVYLMSHGGRVIWKRRLSGRVLSEPVVTDMFVVVTIVGESGASFLDLETGKLLNRVDEGDEYGAIGPVKISDTFIFAGADDVYSYSAGTCVPK